MKRFLVIAAAFAAVGILVGVAVAANGPAVKVWAPIASNSPDSGTCGNDWASDTFNRVYKVRTSPNADGTYSFSEEFKGGSFTTALGYSPGGCETSPPGPSTPLITSSFTGSMHGSFDVVVTGGTYNPNATCAAPCYTASFVAAVYGPSATYDVPTYEFHYAAGRHGEWKNASADRGGNHGDITG
jgi:hypothetical protein